ncbi:DUF4251 domain-containing protein [soil metagenome]|jgi:hypothetical protein
MKTSIKLILVLAVAFAFYQPASAQNTKAQKRAAKEAALKKMVEDANFIFKANYVNPQGGGGHALTSEYDLVISKDTVTAFLPYFGRAYAVNYNSTDGGIKFKTTHFDYKMQQNKKGGWSITIRPKDQDASDMRDVQTLRLSITESGYASLNITSSNREPISFQGTVEGR